MSIDDVNNEEAETQDAPAESFDEGDAAFVSEAKKQDNKGAFGFLLLVLVFGAGFYLFYLRNGPQLAGAANAANAAASTTIDEFLHGNGSNATLMEQTLRETQKVVLEFQATSVKGQVPLESLATNPFRLRPPSQEKVEDASAAKSREQLVAEKARIEREAGSLELQSVMRGSKSACMINNAMYHAGEQIGGFTVVEIRPRSVVVRQGTYRFELTMKR